LVFLVSCGYSTESMMVPGVQSVAVALAENATWYRQAEVTYTREVTREILRHPGVTLRSESDAQAILRSKILTIPRLTLIEDDRDQILEGGVLVEVEFTLVDARDGAVLVPPTRVVRRAENIVPRPESLGFAVDEALVEAARDTVVQLMSVGFLLHMRP
jgi:hypothetical protein